jgi:hypothetical protein
MGQSQWSTFEFRKNGNYQVYIRLKQEDLNAKHLHLFTEIGFSQLNEAELKKIQLNKPLVRILTINKANTRFLQVINSSDILDELGPESLGFYSGNYTYIYRKVGIMLLSLGNQFWDLELTPDLSHTDQMVGLRIMLVRFLAHALSDQGIISYWGTVKDGSVIMMKQLQSFGEAIFIDVRNKVIFSNGGETKFSTGISIIRKDNHLRKNKFMTREDLIGFLSVNTCLFSFSNITSSMKKNIFELSSLSTASFSFSENEINL